MPLFVITVALWATAMAAPPVEARVQDDAAKTYATKCAMCHGAKGAGDGAAAAALDPKPANFTSAEYQKGRTDEEIAAVIKDGKGAMPGYGKQLSAEAIAGLVAYIRSFGAAKS